MSLIGLTAIVVLLAATLIGMVIFAMHRGRINGRIALLLMLIILGGGSLVLVYPSTLTIEGGEQAHL